MSKPYVITLKDVPEDIREIIFEKQYELSRLKKRSASIKETLFSIIRKSKKSTSPS